MTTELVPDVGGRMLKRRVLVIEDNEINREMLKEILSEHYDIIEAEDGQEGLEKLNENFRSLSLILLDVQMPRMNGYEFLERYRADPVLSSVPVIVTTGSNMSEDEERCLALGASDFVTKPYNPRIILRRAEAIVRLHESIATLQAVERDTLTGLLNKAAFLHHAGLQFSYCPDKNYDLLLLNVEDFAYYNERDGEAAGDELLRHIGKALLAYGTDAILCCRYNADRFVLMREHREEDRETVAAEFDKQLHEGAPGEDFTLKYAAYDNVDRTVPISTLCDRLALAVGTIRHQYNRRIVCYDAEMSARFARLRKIEDCMEDSLAAGHFKVFYQPKHDVKTGAIIGAEALVRWIHPELGFISPGDFIPLFEENGFITDLDLYVYRTVCRDLRLWREAGIAPVPVSVNASRRDFLAISDADVLLRPLEENGVDRKYLHIEITESFCIDDKTVMQRVAAVRNLGFLIELDDFGAGQSSLGTIRDIPMDVIKLDISFARAIEKQREVVRMIISLAHALSLCTVAEGVETEEQLKILAEFNCDAVQGYYYSKPLPEADFRDYLSRTARIDA